MNKTAKEILEERMEKRKTKVVIVNEVTSPS